MGIKNSESRQEKKKIKPGEKGWPPKENKIHYFKGLSKGGFT